MAQRLDMMQREIVSNLKRYESIVADPQNEIKDIFIVDNEKLIITFKRLESCMEPLRTSSMPNAVFTTSHAR